MPYYYTLDRENSGEYRVSSFKEAMKVAEHWIEEYRGNCDEDGWPEGVEQIEIFKYSQVTEHPDEEGVLVAKSTVNVLEERPDDVGEDGYAESDNCSTYWGDHFTAIVEYQMQVETIQ